MQIKWGIAAAGRITHDFVTALGTLSPEHHKIIAVADPEIERSQNFSKQHNIPLYYGSFEELAKNPDIQIIYIGTINPFHYQVTKLMLENGKNVLCEKPICLNYLEAAQLYKLAYSKKLFLMEGMWSRFFPSYKYLMDIINTKQIGEILEVHVEHGFKADGIERINNRKLGGGITIDIGIYAIQFGQMLFQKYPDKIDAKCIKMNDDRVDLSSEFTLDYGNRKCLYAKISGMENLQNKAIIKGENGEIIMENYWCCTSLKNPDGILKTWPLPNGKFDFIHTNSCGLRYEAEEVRTCFEQLLNTSPLYTWQNSLELISIMSEIRRKLGVKYD